MGAMPFEILAPWCDDPREALRALQAEFVDENYDLPKLLQEHIDSAKKSVEYCEQDGDEYGLLDDSRAHLAMLESIASKPIPEAAEERVKIVRKIWQYGGEGVGNILDITDVTDAGGMFVARRMLEAEVEQHLGTSQPTAEEGKELLGKIADKLGRAETVCFPVYENDKAVGWWFTGYTLD